MINFNDDINIEEFTYRYDYEEDEKSCLECEKYSLCDNSKIEYNDEIDFNTLIKQEKDPNKNYKKKHIKKINRIYKKEIKKLNDININYYNILYNEINILNNIKYDIIDYNKIIKVKNKMKGILFISYFINRYINYRMCENSELCGNKVVPGEDHCQSCIDEQQTVDSDDYIIDEKLKNEYIKKLENKRKNINYKGYLLEYIEENLYETEFKGMVYKMNVKFLKNKIDNYILNNKN